MAVSRIIPSLPSAFLHRFVPRGDTALPAWWVGGQACGSKALGIWSFAWGLLLRTGGGGRAGR